jgi:branched-chain amino acid transport system substrate-binding protein
MAQETSRREFLSRLGVTVGAAALGSSVADVAAPPRAGSAEPAKGRIPDKPLKFGHITFTSGPGALLGEHSWKGHLLAVEEINAEGGLLGKRKIESFVSDESAGPDANVKELRRMKLSVGIDWFTGVIAVHNTVALAPVAEELKIPTIFTEGCGDLLFEKVVPNPHYVFATTNILSADGVSSAVAVSTTWPEVRKVAHIHPDYAFGRWFFAHFNVAIEKLLPGVQVVSEGWPKLGERDFTPHITKIIAAKPDLLATSLWGGDYVTFYKQALRLGLFDKMKVCASIGFGCVPHSIGKDHPEGIIAGAHSNYFFTHPAGNRWPLNKQFVERFYKRWKEYPNLEGESAYTGMYLLKTAVEKANKLVGGWPDTEAIITQLEGLSMAAPSGYVAIRREDHRAYKDIVVGFSKNLPEYPFPVWDPQRIMTMPVRHMTAPPNWPKPGQGHDDISATYNWIKTTWPKVAG